MAGSRPPRHDTRPDPPPSTAPPTDSILTTTHSSRAFPDPIPGVIAFGTVTLFAGAPAVGKTTLLADWCRAWRDGAPILGHPTSRPTALCYISGDRPWQEYQPMFEAAGYPDIPHYALVEDGSVSLASLRKPYEAHQLFNSVLDRINPPPGAHVIVDPISPLFITGDPNRQRDVAVSLIGFARRCHERQINITCTVHFGKQKADKNQRYARPQDRIAGSTSFSGFSCTQVYFVDPELPKETWHTLGWNPRHSAPETFKLTRDPVSKLFVPYTAATAAPEPLETIEHVSKAFPTPPDDITLEALVGAVHGQYGLSRATVKRALQSLILARRVLRMGRGRYRKVGPVAVSQA